MAQLALTERQLRERKYYDHFVARRAVDVGSLAAVRGEERRPWNPYWFVTEMVRERFTASTQRLLDFGCGHGTYSVLFAHLGYRVTGFDVSPRNVEAARALAARYGMSERTRFDVGVAEALDYPSSHFDIVVGIDILHHVEVASAAAECLRVLKPEGIAVFKEPVAVPLFDRLRNTPLGLRHPSQGDVVRPAHHGRRAKADASRSAIDSRDVFCRRASVPTPFAPGRAEWGAVQDCSERVKAGNRRRSSDARVADAASLRRQRRASLPAPSMTHLAGMSHPQPATLFARLQRTR